jgi:hypothetical protein
MFKNKNLYLGIIIIIMVLSLFFFSRHERVFLAEPANLLTLKVNLEDKKPLKQQLYGFNTEQMNAEYTYSEPEYTTLVSKLKPRSLRFPGGAVANFYHWKISGFIENELSSTNSPNLNNRNIGNYRKLVSRRNGELSFDEFMELCETLSVKPVIALNLYTGSPSESADWVRYVKDKGYEIAGWELGNELYLAAYRNKFPTVKAYVEVAKQHAAAMRSVDSNIRLAAVATTTGFHLNQRGVQADFEKSWNAQLAKETFFDSYAVHMYTFSRDRRLLPLDELRGLLFGSSDSAFRRAIEYSKKLFGNREVWVTEWNIADPRNRVANTQLHAMYCGDFFLSLLSYQEQASIANYHVLAGAGKGFTVFSPRTEEDMHGENRSVERACYPVFQLIGETLDKSETEYLISFQNNPKFQGILEFKNEFLESFKLIAVGKDNQHLFILISNRTSKVSRLTIELNEKPVSGMIQYRYVANSDLVASNGGNSVIPGKQKNEITIQSWKGAVNELRIPSNSFGVIELL